MKPIDPTPYVGVYVVVVFVVPWLIGCGFTARSVFYARRRGISLFSISGGFEARELRQIDRHAAFLHRRALKWFLSL